MVAGSEAFSKQILQLPELKTDFNNCEVSPPGRFSPYGQALTCLCNEETGRYKITDDTIDDLRAQGVPEDVLTDLEPIKDQEVIGEKEFLDVLSETIGEERTNEYRLLLLQYAKFEDPACLTLGDVSKVIIRAEPTEVPGLDPDGIVPPFTNVIRFTVEGGVEFLYTVETTAGQLSHEVVKPNQEFFLTTDANQNGELVTITVTDVDVGFVAVVGIRQNFYEP